VDLAHNDRIPFLAHGRMKTGTFELSDLELLSVSNSRIHTDLRHEIDRNTGGVITFQQLTADSPRRRRTVHPPDLLRQRCRPSENKRPTELFLWQR
jgi:hypothetical protein